MRLSAHFTVEELSQTLDGIPNDPPLEVAANLVRLADSALEPARFHAGGPVHVSAGGGYRCLELNRHVRGAKTSAHLEGRAADIVPERVSCSVLFDLIRASAIPFDQVILERRGDTRWIHLAIARVGETPRRQALLGEVDPVTRAAVYTVAP